MALRTRRRCSIWAGTVLAAASAVLLALVVTPPVTVAAFGQQIALGAVRPDALRGLSGPGQADLFGEGAINTRLEFSGLLRPHIEWRRFSADAAAAAFISTSPDTGPSLQTGELGSALGAGWISYLLRLGFVAAAAAAVLRLAMLGAEAAVLRERALPPHGRRVALHVTAAAIGALLVVSGSAAVTTASVRQQLTGVRTLADITGTAPLVPGPASPPPGSAAARVVVLGDSTAAGVGNAPLPKPTPVDSACGRSADAYAVVLGRALGTATINLACSSATTEAGLLGAQDADDVIVPAQLGVLQSLRQVRTVVVSVGANDVGWADFIRICYGLERCDDQVVQRLFENRLDTFRLRYAQLLQQLRTLPGRPQVVVVQYYDPFGDRFDCAALRDPSAPRHPPAGYGFAGDDQVDQATRIRTKIDPMRAEVAALNEVLVQGAAAFGFATASPSFDGHGLCSQQPWVQGLSDPFPFHPDAAGELAIAAAVLPHVVAGPTG